MVTTMLFDQQNFLFEVTLLGEIGMEFGNSGPVNHVLIQRSSYFFIVHWAPKIDCILSSSQLGRLITLCLIAKGTIATLYSVHTSEFKQLQV